MTKHAWLVLNNQLFPGEFYARERAGLVFMAESHDLCTRFRFHKQRLIFFLTAMRHRADRFREDGFRVSYQELTEDAAPKRLEDHLAAFIERQAIDGFLCYEIEDHFLEHRVREFCACRGLSLEILTSPMFLTERALFADYLARNKPFMKTFYERQRKRLEVMVVDGEPQGGRWSFDTENRKKLPKKQRVPDLPKVTDSEHAHRVTSLVATLFSDHPGRASTPWLPTTREGSLAWLDTFLDRRLYLFGPYEDALTGRHDVVFHAVLSPMMNLGLILPNEILEKTMAYATRETVPLPSLEGFVRQVIGWREFIRGIYRHFDKKQRETNFFGHRGALGDCWYEGGTGIPILDDVIEKIDRLAWAHHIERLMVLGNLMLLCEVHPLEVYRWFMEMFLDSSDWVMGPNVFGMSQFSDGGIFATKPYICGSSYLLKMSDYGRGDWCDIVDGLYWRFIGKNRRVFANNHRMSMMVKMYDRLDDARRNRITREAEAFIDRVTRRDCFHPPEDRRYTS